MSDVEKRAREAVAAGDVAAAVGALVGLRHFNAHDFKEGACCLCARCVRTAVIPEGFVLDVVAAEERAFFYVFPVELLPERERLAERMRRRLVQQLHRRPRNPPRTTTWNRWMHTRGY